MKQNTESALLPNIAEQQAAAERLCHSSCFRRSPRLRDMLVYILECTLNGRSEELTETRIALKVFGRSAYNPAEENLVRASARQLRNKLAEYQQGEGRDDNIVVEIPKGKYLATFRPRGEAERPEPLEIRSGPDPAQSRSSVWLVWGLLAIAVAFTAMAAALWRENREFVPFKAVVSSQKTLFDAILPGPGQRTDLILPDSALILWSGLTHRNLSLNDYASDHNPLLAVAPAADVPESGLIGMLRTQQLSRFADFRIVFAILQDYPQFARHLSLHHARSMHVRDFDSGDNFVLIGGYYSNPWASLFEKSANFHLQKTNDGSGCFVNKHPLPGEQKVYCSATTFNAQGTDYAHITVVHNGDHGGRVLLIAGIHLEGTEAAGEFLLNPHSVPEVLKSLHCDQIRHLPDYELLLKIYSVGGTGRSAQLISARRL